MYLREWDKWGWHKQHDLASRAGELNNAPPIPRIAAADLSVEEFKTRFLKPQLPVIITGLVDDWPAMVCGWQGVPVFGGRGVPEHRTAPRRLPPLARPQKHWTPEALYEHARHRKFKCGEDDDGYAVRMKLKYFLRYMASQQDDSPLYIFESRFDDKARWPAMRDHYSVPEYFREDLFDLVPEKMRPPHRWWLVGPQRSGTVCHIDPLGTSAWNACVHGKKRWVLIPPATSAEYAKAKAFQARVPDASRKSGTRALEDDEAIDYFHLQLPRAIAAAAKAGTPMQVYDFVQEPGDLMYVPGGWWHAVLNITDTVAVTQNFASPEAFDAVWTRCRRSRKRLAARLLGALRVKYPALAARALELNARNDFVMQFVPGDDGRIVAKHSRKHQRDAEIDSSSSDTTDTSDGEVDDGRGY